MCTGAANLFNERPIGTLPSSDSDLNVLTPNSLLLGRSRAAIRLMKHEVRFVCFDEPAVTVQVNVIRIRNKNVWIVFL